MPSHRPLQYEEHEYPNGVVIQAVTDSDIAKRVKGRHWLAVQRQPNHDFKPVAIFVTWQQTKYYRDKSGKEHYEPIMLRASWVISDEDGSEAEVLVWANQKKPVDRWKNPGPHPDRLFDRGEANWKSELKALPDPRRLNPTKPKPEPKPPQRDPVARQRRLDRILALTAEINRLHDLEEERYREMATYWHDGSSLRSIQGLIGGAPSLQHLHRHLTRAWDEMQAEAPRAPAPEPEVPPLGQMPDGPRWTRQARLYRFEDGVFWLYTISSVADAVGKTTAAIYRWLENGVIPPEPRRTPARIGSLGDSGVRLWTYDQIAALERIGREEGVFGKTQNTEAFKTAVWKYWVEQGWA